MSPSTQTWLPHRQKAEQLGVSTKTLDRYIAAGVIDKPRIVNGRKFHAANSQPRHDHCTSENAA